MFVLPITLLSSIYIVYGIKKYDYETTIRILSLMHSTISFFITSLYLNDYINIENLMHTVNFNIIFLIIDTHLYITDKISNKDRKIMLIHHFMFLLAALLSKEYPIYYCRCLICETSTIFLNLRWFSQYKLFNLENFINILSLMLWFSFIVFRVFNLTQLTYIFIINNNYNLLNILIPFLFMNYYWAFGLTKKGILMLKNK